MSLNPVTLRPGRDRLSTNPIAIFLFVWVYRWFPSVLGAFAIPRPETIICWHRTGFQSYWRGWSRKRVGRPRISAELRPAAEWISRQITEAFPWDSAPRYLIRDRDTAYGPIFRTSRKSKKPRGVSRRPSLKRISSAKKIAGGT